MRNSLKSKGFTLIELVIVMTLVGILVAIALPQFQNLAPTARGNVKNSTVGSVKSAFSLFVATNDGDYPTVEELALETIPQGTAVASGVQFADDQAVNFVVNTFIDEDCGTPTSGTTGATRIVACVSGHTP